MNAVQQLRSATAISHDRVDAAFGGFDLADRTAYAAFLLAHARALPAVERAVASFAALPAVRSRAAMLADDLDALGQIMPEPLPFALADEAEGWGALYVAEGSRLGGIMLAGQVGTPLPSAYLSARHDKGEWRALLAAIDAAAEDQAWIDRAVAGAQATFTLYAAAVA